MSYLVVSDKDGVEVLDGRWVDGGALLEAGQHVPNVGHAGAEKVRLRGRHHSLAEELKVARMRLNAFIKLHSKHVETRNGEILKFCVQFRFRS